MTSRVQAKITYNHPVTVTFNGSVVFQSEGEPGTYTGEKVHELDQWFSGSQEIVIAETKKPE